MTVIYSRMALSEAFEVIRQANPFPISYVGALDATFARRALNLSAPAR